MPGSTELDWKMAAAGGSRSGSVPSDAVQSLNAMT